MIILQMIIKWSWSMSLWCLWCTFLKWSGSEACANQGRSRWAAAPANESNSTPTVTIPKLQWTLSVLLHWVGNYIQYMILYVSLAIGAGFLLLCMTLFLAPWNAEIPDTKLQKTSLQTVSISQTSVKKTYQSYPSLSILIIIEYHWSIMTYQYHCFPHVSTFFHVFIRFHPFSLSGSSDLPILPPRPGMALGAMLSSVTFPGDRSDKMWQVSNKYQISLNLPKFKWFKW